MLGDYCRQHLLEEKWLLAGSLRSASQWKQQLAMSGVAAVNLHPHTLHSAVIRLTQPLREHADHALADASFGELLMQQLLIQSEQSGQLRYFSRVRDLTSVSGLVLRTITDLRLAEIAELDPDCFDNPDRAADLQRLMDGYDALLKEQRLWDYADCLRALLAEDGSPPGDKPAAPAMSEPVLLLVSDLAGHHLECKIIAKWNQQARALDCQAAGPSDDAAQQPLVPPQQLRVIAAEGEVNEVRGVMRRLLLSEPPIPLDQVELLYSDYTAYGPLLHHLFLEVAGEEELGVEQLPITFAEGIACVYSRPGRALRAWIRWQRNDFPQSHLVQMIREGLVEVGNEEVGYGYARAASTLRKTPIGVGRDRYRSQLVRAIRTAESRLQIADANPALAAEESNLTPQATVGGDYGLAMLKQLHKWIGRLLDLCPGEDASAEQLLETAEQFLLQFARRAAKFDQVAVERLIDAIRSQRQMLDRIDGLPVDLWNWLEELPVATHVLGSGPRPGCLHVDRLGAGGASGRPHLVVVGLDDSRLSLHARQDPLLLDEERQRLAKQLSDSQRRRDVEVERIRRVFVAQRESITLSYARRSMIEDRLLFPSSLLLQLYRELREVETATEDDLLAASDSIGFLTEQGLLGEHRWQTAALLEETDLAARTRSLERWKPMWAVGRAWLERQKDALSLGDVDGLLPEAGPVLDPTGEVADRISASALEAYGCCPRRYFFRRGLRIKPPDELVLEDGRWLDPLTYGALVHSIFESFMIRLTEQQRPPEFARDWPELEATMQAALVEAEKTMPVRDLDARQRQEETLQKTCRIFLREEERYCREQNATPLVMEASIGLGEAGGRLFSCDEPPVLTLSDGRQFAASGMIDRIDQLGADDGGAAHLAIWDYKSGSDFGYQPEAPFAQGRKLQPFLYVSLLRHQLQAEGRPGDVAQFGYFFPGPRTNGRRIQWTTAELKTGDQVLRQIFDSIRAGCFLATTAAADCKYCDYLEICGDPRTTADRTLVKLENSDSSNVDAYRELRELDGGAAS